jgi:hypothetical protein
MEAEKKGPVNGKEGGPIALKEAAEWTKNYREKHPGDPISQLFGREILEGILAQDGCLGVRFYYAHDHGGKKHLVVTGVSADGSDQIHENMDTVAAEAPVGGVISADGTGDQSMPCPGSPGCPKNVLTGGN